MDEKSKVQVRIYGQEFTVSGDTSREHIIKVADHVDRTMHELAEEFPSSSTADLAILAAVNTANELYKNQDSVDVLRDKNKQLEKDAQHYVHLWDEAKRNFIQYKEDAMMAAEKNKELENSFFDLQMENIKLKAELEKLQKEYE